MPLRYEAQFDSEIAVLHRLSGLIPEHQPGLDSSISQFIERQDFNYKYVSRIRGFDNVVRILDYTKQYTKRKDADDLVSYEITMERIDGHELQNVIKPASDLVEFQSTGSDQSNVSRWDLTGEQLLNLAHQKSPETQIDVVIWNNDDGETEEASFEATRPGLKRTYKNVVGMRTKSSSKVEIDNMANLTGRLFPQIAQGVKFMHHLNCVHLDLRPENIMVTTTGKIKIIDLG